MNGAASLLARIISIAIGGGAIALAVVVSGCQNPNAPPAAGFPFAHYARTSGSQIVLTPSSISYGLTAASTTIVHVRGGIPPYSVSQGDVLVADITPAQEKHGRWLFTVTPVAGGSTTVTVRDSHGSHASLAVSQKTCSRLSPALQLLIPNPGSALVPKNVGKLYVGDSNQDPGQSLVTKYFVRLSTASQTFITGSAFVPTPLPSQSPPPANTATYVASIGALEHDKTYYVQVATKFNPCLPPDVISFFKTIY